jgi:hypothetical protein
MNDGTFAALELYMVEVWEKKSEDCIYSLALANTKDQALELAQHEVPTDEDWEEIGTKCENIEHQTGPARTLWSMRTYGY